MNQTEKQNVIIDQEWIEAGGALVPVPQRMPTAQPRRDPNYCPSPQLVDRRRVVTLANRMLCDLTGNIMDHVELLGGYGRIAVVKFHPAQRRDPIMAVPLVEFSGIPGWLHKQAFSELADLLIRLENRWNPVDTNRWYKAARSNGQAIIKHSRKFLHPDEWAYYGEQVTETVTNPWRQEWKV